MEEDRFLPKNWTPEKELLERKLEYENLTNTLMRNSLVSNQELSEGMRQLENIMERIYFLDEQIGWEGTPILTGEWKSELDTRNSQHDLEPYEDSWEEKPMLPVEWKSRGDTRNPPATGSDLREEYINLPEGGISQDSGPRDREEQDVFTQRSDNKEMATRKIEPRP